IISTLCYRVPHLSLLYTATPPPHIYTLSLHDALPISVHAPDPARHARSRTRRRSERVVHRLADRLPHRPSRCHRDRDLLRGRDRSEEHTSELQSRFDLVCRLLLEKKKELMVTRIFYFN